MYDNCHFWLPMEGLENINLNQISSNSPNFRVTDQGGLISYFGHLGGNIRVSISERGVSLKGSISKYLNSNNFDSLNLTDTKRAIEKLSDELFLPINKAKVNYLEIMPQNILLDFSPKIYYPYLIESKKYFRKTNKNSVEFSNGSRTKIFYDKINEIKNHREKIPPSWQNKNVLRYELKMLKKLPEQFNTSIINASMLYSEQFQKKSLNKWYEEFKSINTMKNKTNNFEKIKTTSDFMSYLIIIGIQSLGYENTLNHIEMLKEKKSMSNKEAYSRTKLKIRQLLKDINLTEESDFINELNLKVEEIKNNYSF